MAVKKRKKKRTAKQIAATKKLVVFNKKRRKTNPAKKAVKKKVKRVKSKVKATRKKKVIRKKRRPAKRSSQSDYFVVTKSGKGYKYFDGERFTSHKKNAAMYKSAKAAERIALKIASIDTRKIYVKVEIKK